MLLWVDQASLLVCFGGSQEMATGTRIHSMVLLPCWVPCQGQLGSWDLPPHTISPCGYLRLPSMGTRWQEQIYHREEAEDTSPPKGTLGDGTSATLGWFKQSQG